MEEEWGTETDIDRVRDRRRQTGTDRDRRRQIETDKDRNGQTEPESEVTDRAQTPFRAYGSHLHRPPTQFRASGDNR